MTDSIEKTTSITLDSASLYAVVSYFDSPTTADKWTELAAWRVTYALLGSFHLEIAPGTASSGPPGGAYNNLLQAISIHFRLRSRPLLEGKSNELLAEANSWAQRGGLGDFYRNKLKLSETFGKWLDWSIGKAWTEHSARLGGLFDRAFIPAISSVTSYGSDDLEAIHRKSLSPNWVAAQVKRQRFGDEFSMAVDAYVLSALMRGKFHDSVCDNAGLQVMHHPFREVCLREIDKEKTRMDFLRREMPSPHVAWAYLILIAAAGEPTDLERIAAYGKYISASRAQTDPVLAEVWSVAGLPQTLSDNARKCGILVAPKWIEWACSMAVAFGTGLPLNFLGLDAYNSAAIGAVVSLVTERAGLTRKISDAMMGDLEGLSKQAAGRVYMNEPDLK